MLKPSDSKHIKTVAAVTITLLLIGLVVYGLNQNPQENNDITSETSTISPSPKATNQSTETPTPATNVSSQVGSYVNYTPTIIAETSGTKILFFHAPWCPQCRELEASIQSNTIPAGVTFIKVDYDSNQSLRKKYGVTIQTTLVKIDDAGNLIKKFVAYDEPTLASVSANLLP